MLTRLDLAVLRAALKFFDEEMTPHGTATLQPYFDVRLPAGFGLQTVLELRGRLRTCRPRYVVCDPEVKRLLATDLMVRPSRALRLAQAFGGEVGTVLIPTPPR